jgi:acyl-CoA-binding protein
MELETLFQQAVTNSKSLREKPDNEILLQLYSLYKQATEGDNTDSAPGAFDFVAKFKYDAWMNLKGTSKDVAMQRYIDLVNQLQNN